jgi:hypothetical protein
MTRAQRVRIGCALLVGAGGLMIWATAEYLYGSDGESPELILILSSIPALSLVIIGICLLATSHWFQHK